MAEILYYGDGGDKHAGIALALLKSGVDHTYRRVTVPGALDELFAYTGSDEPFLPVVVFEHDDGKEPTVLQGATRDSLAIFLTTSGVA